MKDTGITIDLHNVDMLKMANTMSMRRFGKNRHIFKKNHQKDLVFFFFLNLFGGFFEFLASFCTFVNI